MIPFPHLVFSGDGPDTKNSGSDLLARLDAQGWGLDTINTGDGLDFMKCFPDGSVAAAVLDPQYRGIMERLSYGNEGARQKGRFGLEQMPDETIREFVAQVDRVLRPAGHLFLWVDKFHLCEGIGLWLEYTDLQIVDLLTWNKGRMGMGYRTRRQSEYCIIIQKTPTRAKGVWTDHGIRDVVEERIGSGPGHPHRKPVDIMSRLLGAVTEPGDIVLDPAAGSFSTWHACRKLPSRYFAGVDLKPQCVPA